MRTSHAAAVYVKTMLVFLACDALWLGWIAPEFYRRHLPHLLAPEPDLAAAAVFYLLYVAGLVKFAILPALATGDRARAFRDGAMFGLVAYATFDLTCQALFRDWPLIVTIVDLCWGTLLSGTACLLVAWTSRGPKEPASSRYRP